MTAEAKSLLPQIETLLEDYRGLEDRFQSEKELSGTIRVTCSAALANRILAPILIEFTQRHPKIRFEIDASDKVVNLIDEQMDLAIRIQRPPADSELIYKRLAPNNLVFCASPNYLSETKVPIKNAKDLHRHPLIMFPVYVHCSLEGTGFTLKDFVKSKRIDANSGTLLTELALKGAGIAVRSIWDVRDFISRGELVQVLTKVKIINPVEIYAVIPGRRWMTVRVRTFLNFLEAKATEWR